MVENETSSVEYALSTSTGPFAIPFYFLENGHIVAELYTLSSGEYVQTILTLDTDYTLSGAGNENGGTLTLNAARSGSTLLIYRDPEATQLTSYVATGKFPATSHERALDKLTMLIQKFSWWWDRLALKKPNIFASYYDARQNRISNLVDPELGQDAVTRKWALTEISKVVTASSVDMGSLANTDSEALGDALIGVKQPYTGAVARTQHDKNAEYVSVMDFGAKGDGVTDDSVAIQIAANTGAIYFPPGNYLVSKDITISSTNDCVIKGFSRANTSITYTGTGTLFTAKFTNSIRFVQVSDIRVMTTTLAKATAFYFEWPEDFEHGLVQRGSFFNVSIRGVNEYEQGFNTCVHMHQGDNINFINCEFKGAGGSTTVTQAYNTRCAIGVNITGRFSPVEYRFIACYIGSFDVGIKVEDTAEGIYLTDCILICVKIGVNWQTGKWSDNWPVNPGGNASGRPLLSISKTHFNYYQYGVYTSGVVSIHESDLLLYHNDNGTQNGIALAHGNGTEVFINNIESWGFNSNYYTDGVVFYEFITYSGATNIRGVSGANNSYRYVVENRAGCTNNIFREITRRVTGGNFVNNTLINDVSGGLVDIGIRGGFFYSTANQTVPSGSSAPTTVNFGARDYDPVSLWPGSGGEITMPAGVSRIRITGGVLLDSATTASYRELRFTINGNPARGLGQQSTTSVAGKGTYMNIASGVILVTPGDTIRMVVGHDDGATRSLISNYCWMQVEIIG